MHNAVNSTSEDCNTAVPLAFDAHPTWSGSSGFGSSFKGCSTYGSRLSESFCQIPTFLLNSRRLSNIRYDYFEIEISNTPTQYGLVSHTAYNPSLIPRIKLLTKCFHFIINVLKITLAFIKCTKIRDKMKSFC